MATITEEQIIQASDAFVNKYESIDNPLYVAFNSDVQYLPLCFQILNQCWSIPNAQYFAGNALYNLVRAFSPQWPNQFITDCKENIFNFYGTCLQNIQTKFAPSTNLAIDKVTAAYAMIIKISLSSFNSLPYVVNEINTNLESDIPQAINLKFNIFRQLIDIFSKDANLAIFTQLDLQYHFTYEVFMIAVMVIRNNLYCTRYLADGPKDPKSITINDEITQTALGLMDLALEVHLVDIAKNAVTKDEVLSEELDLKPIWQSEITSAENYKFIFSLAFNPIFTEKAFKIIYKLGCVKRAMFTSEELHYNAFLATITAATQFLSDDAFVMNNQDLLFFLIKLLYKIRIRILSFPKLTENMEEYKNFLMLLKQRTLQFIENGLITKQPYMMMYLMKLWCYAVPDISEFNEMFLTYIINIIELPVKSDTDQIEESFDDCRYDECITVIPLRCPANVLSDFAKSVIDHLINTQAQFNQALLSASEVDDSFRRFDMQMAIIVGFLATILKRPLQTIDEPQIQAFCAIMKTLINSKETLDACYHAQLPYLERSLMIFCHQLKRTNLADQKKFDKVFAAITDCEAHDLAQACNILIERITMSLISFPDDEVTIRLGVNALDSVISIIIKNKIKDAMNAEILLQSFVDHPFDFMVNVKNKRSTINASRILTTIALSSQPATEYFQGFLDQNYQMFLSQLTTEVFKALLYNFIGTFQACTKKNDFDTFFYWLFPEKLEQIITVIDSINDPSLLSDFFKFLFSTIQPQENQYSAKDKKKDITAKISFPPHSSNGVQLFALLAQALKRGFSMLSEFSMADQKEMENVMKPFKSMTRLMSEIMKADYVMFDAFDLYEDKTIDELLASYFRLLSMIDMTSFFNLKCFSILLSLVDSLSSYHMERVINCDACFIQMMFDFIIQVFRGKEYEGLMKSAMSSAKNIIKFFCDNAESHVYDEVLKSIEIKFRNVVRLLWQFLLNDHTTLCYDVALILRPALVLCPPLLQALHDESVQFIPEDSLAFYDGCFAKIENCESIEDLNKVLLEWQLFAKNLQLNAILQFEA
ncbi:hypothetical protein TVAG_488110 [Trichomonas vaginalis G3]|uniref:Exportin-1/Importin-beta-like domain-containing protein n=1 Tax=Trichomonas vaginalis (strain ATCC PRA-98 / G3) TaxID=412133 RepID=A2E6K4_TRIV3|nr:exportin 4,7-related family [Trichomonas vaginalis G3]EAY11709.1 hypothetical protein TVAG_488110 [Trichomonas vaginalis G3]KAI5488851.1 exportin 4,7-related family [Trichomonas vaginalis G3]|eukprot:XP_001323932.1 hypothetical protein [Trichomonas vaginalis G3]